MAEVSPLSNLTAYDPTWAKALTIVQNQFQLSASTWSLIRSSWNGSLSQREYVHMLGFSRMNLLCLIDAAGLLKEKQTLDASLLDQSLRTLGMRLSAVVLGVNYCCQTVLLKKPPPLWRKIFQEMMTRIEIGYHFGSKVGSLGVEGGSLIGFAHMAGQAILLAENQTAFKKWFHTQPEGSAPFPVNVFGCEPYQAGAFVLQQLGYGHEVAIGAALGSGRVDMKRVEADERIRAWYAAYLWIEALRQGRNFPAATEVRQAFHEIAPGRDSTAPTNLNLEVLYTAVAKIRSAGSIWTWHLPRPGYSDTTDWMAEIPA